MALVRGRFSYLTGYFGGPYGGGVEKPLIAVYKDVRMNNRLWAPGYDKARQIIVKCGKVHQLESLPDLIMSEIDPGTLQQGRAG